MIKIKFILLLVVFANIGHAQITAEDFKKINGQWKGTLTYTDYSDDATKTTLKVSMDFNWLKKHGKITTTFLEPNGTEIQDKSKIKSKKKGTKIIYDGNSYLVKEFETQNNSDGWKLLLIGDGKDNGKNASIKQTFLFKKNQLSITKEISYNKSNYFIRNIYAFEKE